MRRFHLPISEGSCPEIELYPSQISLSRCNFPSSEGMVPDSWLFSKSSSVRFPRCPNSVGILPESEFWYNAIRWTDRSRCNGRIFPLIWFWSAVKRVSRVKSPIAGGIEPLNRFWLSRSWRNFRKFPSSGGSEPLRVHLSIRRPVRLEIAASSVGILPYRSLSPRSSRERDWRFARNDGMRPGI